MLSTAISLGCTWSKNLVEHSKVIEDDRGKILKYLPITLQKWLLSHLSFMGWSDSEVSDSGTVK